MPALRTPAAHLRVGSATPTAPGAGARFFKWRFLMSRLIETLILYLALAAFAIYGVTWGAEKVGQFLNQRMIKTSTAPAKVSL